MDDITYQLADSLCLYRETSGKILIVIGQRGQTCRMSYSHDLFDMLTILKEPMGIDALSRHLPQLTKQSLVHAVHRLLDAGVLESITHRCRRVNCLLIGCGSIGSHIFDQLSMLGLHDIAITDDDIVDESNIWRQKFNKSDCGLLKVDVLASQPGKTTTVIPIAHRMQSARSIQEIVERHRTNIIIQAGDFPSVGALGHWVNTVADHCNIPYIINPGYIGGAVALPEFYYPRMNYGYTSSHHSWNANVLFQFQREKIPYRLCSQLASLVAQQVHDYQHFRIPQHYGEKGYFDTTEYAWRTQRVSPRPHAEPSCIDHTPAPPAS